MPRPPPRKFVREVAGGRIERLFSLAEETVHTEPELAQRYVDLALKMGMRCRVRLTQPQRRVICHKCKTYLQPGVNARIRTRQNREPHVSISCLSCGAVMRIPLKPLTEKLHA